MNTRETHPTVMNPPVSAEEMPAWPEKREYWNAGPPQHPVEYWKDARERDYERALKDAYAARLRVAVAAIREWGCAPDPAQECPMCRMLSLIGPLPPDSGEGK